MENKESTENNTIYYLFIESDGKPKIAKDQILTIKKNTILHLELLNGTPISYNVSLVSNAKKNFPFHFIEKKKTAKDPLKKEDFSDFIFDPISHTTSIEYEIELNVSGPIQFAFLYQDEASQEFKLTDPFFVIVQPEIVIKGEKIGISSIQLQTILSKSLGKIDNFSRYYQEAKNLNFNFVHFTPIQQLGVSESLYCLRDNTKINNIFFDSDSLSDDEKLEKFKNSIEECRNKYGIGSIVDIVLNHAADNSEWLGDHPECGYNLVNTPWLNCAYELDKIYTQFSDRFCECKTNCNSQPYVRNEADLNKVIQELNGLINNGRLYEFFLINIGEQKNIFKQFYADYESDKDSHRDRINAAGVYKEGDLPGFLFDKCLDKLGEERNGVVVDVEKFGHALLKFSRNEGDFLSKFERACNFSNEKWTNTAKGFLSVGLENVKNGIRYQFIEMKNKAEKKKVPLVNNYFAVFDPNDKNKIFACNGWIMESEDKNEPTPNFTKKNSYYYFKRKVMIWSDCPKLNYGTCPEDCPYLIQHMTKYVQDMAKIFNGFRLDNAHSTPIYLAEYLAEQARKVNPDLLIIAELFTTKENEINFVNKIGINLLIRELIWCYDNEGLSSQIHRFGGGNEEMLGQLEEDKFIYRKVDDENVEIKKMKYLLPRLPNSIIFDMTHDNETYHQKYNNLALNMTDMACCSFAASAVASTRGYDQLFPIQPSVVKESRVYEYDDEFNRLVESTEPKKEETFEKEKKVVFEYRAQNANSVSIALDSRGWKPDINLDKVSNDTFRKELTLENGRTYYYKFVINGSNWVYDNSKPNRRDNSGNINNYISLGQETNAGGKNSYHVKDLKMFRRKLNEVRKDLLHHENEFFLTKEGQFLTIFRSFKITEEYVKNPPNYDGYVLICRTGFDRGGTNPVKVQLPGIYSEFVCGSSMRCGNIDIDGFKRSPTLRGTPSDVYFTLNPSYLNSITQITTENNKTCINFNSSIEPNTVVILKYKLSNDVKDALINIERKLKYIDENWKSITKDFSICDINLILFKCEREELENSHGKRGNYKINNWKTFVYAGISQIHKMLNQFKKTKENHPILDNIREGDWLLKYSIDRYSDQPNIKELYQILSDIYNSYTKLYVHYKPLYMTKIIDAIYNVVMKKIMHKTLNKEVANFSPLSQKLLYACFQMSGYVESSRFKFNTSAPYNKLSISAGLPHFSSEYMRCWGRDTFISYPGYLLLPGYFPEAKEILINYGSTMRHGLIPNLLDSGVKPRYNARDATWFFMRSAVEYIKRSGDDKILEENVDMLFLSDNINEHYNKKNKGEKRIIQFGDILHEIMQKHAQGMDFREWNAGREIDEQMKDGGFNIKIYLDKETGFIYGGNKLNCGTWMDKMGSSERAGNKGNPATPRNGADIEIIALLYCSLVGLSKLHKEGKYKYDTVKLNDGTEMTYEDWANKIKANFEKSFFVEHKNEFTPNNTIYKDYISDDNDKRHEHQLRPNIFIAMTAAPELFEKDHALKCIEVAEEHLVVKNCVGIRTLDNQDKNYDGDYILSDDSNNYHKAHGFNYHNGPEWVFPFGYYLHSKVLFNDCKTRKELVHKLCNKMLPIEKYIDNDDWSGLPELTNKNGSLCPGSCCTQAWSIATVFEAIDKLFGIELTE